MRVLVCGGRDFCDRAWLYSVLDTLPNVTEIISGGATGADRYAIHWALEHRIPYKEYPANWQLHGRGAGVLRNQQMLNEARPDLVVAFPGGRGTADMVRRSKDAKVPVTILLQKDNDAG